MRSEKEIKDKLDDGEEMFYFTYNKNPRLEAYIRCLKWVLE